MSLAADGHTLLPGHPLLLLILLHSSQEVITTAGVLDMLNTKVDTLLQNPIPTGSSFGDKQTPHGDNDPLPNLFVDDDSYSSLRHVENPPSFPMVILVRHSLLKSSIALH